MAFDLEVDGQIPVALNGAMYRVGSNPHYRPLNPARYHRFESDGMVHAVPGPPPVRDGPSHK